MKNIFAWMFSEKGFGTKKEKTGNKNGHYYKDVTKYKQLDVYRVLKLFNVTDQNIGHAVKKLLAPGCRSGGKSFEQDIIDARDSLNRLLEMIEEDSDK